MMETLCVLLIGRVREKTRSMLYRGRGKNEISLFPYPYMLYRVREKTRSRFFPTPTDWSKKVKMCEPLIKCANYVNIELEMDT